MKYQRLINAIEVKYLHILRYQLSENTIPIFELSISYMTFWATDPL